MVPGTDNTDPNLNAGIPAHGSPYPNDSQRPAAPAVTPPAADPTTAKTVFKLGNKTFDSAEEASRYVETLEAIQSQSQAPAAAPAAPAVAKPMIDGRPIEDVIFEDPNKVIDYAVSKAVSAIDSRREADETRLRLWNRFYEKNPDLRGKERILNGVFAENLQDWKHLSEEEGFKRLAAKTRSEIKAMGLESGKITDLPPNSAPASLSPTGGQPVATGDETTTQSSGSSFTDELMAMRAKRTKAKQ